LGTALAKQRLQKILAAAGVDSRRNCETLILEGAVRVNRKVVDELPAFADPDTDIITVHGRRIEAAKKVYFLLNKPKGVICTNYDPQGRRKAIDLIPTKERVYCVGRLDVDTSGLIIVTNDSDLTNRLTHPKFGLSKRYVATVDGKIQNADIERLKKGIWLSEGKMSMEGVKILKSGPQQSTVEISLKQGLNRQIRRMLARVGFKVKDLKRTRIARIELKGLGSGRYRMLTSAEVAYLKRATDKQD
jgi:23S rRNA pseudouridine2605 synthase